MLKRENGGVNGNFKQKLGIGYVIGKESIIY